MTTLRSALGRLLALLLLVSSASACVSIPDSGPVREADGVGVEDRSQPITNVVLGPSAGASPAEIVTGFYAAMLAYPRTSEKARQFLTPAAASSWDPESSLTVYDNPDIVASDRRVSVTTTVMGSLDTRGTWTSSAAGGVTGMNTLRVVPVDGEWRIANPLEGTFVDTDFFTRFYDAFSLYFFDPSRTILTPDPVYLPVGDTTPTSLVRDLLLGPTSDLEGAVSSAVPADTELEVPVSISRSGVAEVSLSADVLKLSAADRQLFAAQLAWTLRQVPEIDQIAISVDGSELAIENAGTPFDANAFAGYDPAGLSGERRLFALGKEGLVTVTPTDVSPVLGPIRAEVEGASVAVQTSGQLAAVVRPDRTSIAVGAVQSVPETGVATWFTGGTRLLRPSWDAQQVLWVVDQTAAGAAIYTVTEDQVRTVKAPGLDGRDIVAFAVSRDGVRLAAIVRDGTESRLVLATIDRDDAEDPTVATLRRAVTIATSNIALTGLRDLAWVSPTSVAVLGQVARDDVQPYEVAIDGSDTEAAGGFLPAVPVSIAAGPNVDAPIAVATRGGQVYVQTPDLQWLPISGDNRLRAPAYPG